MDILLKGISMSFCALEDILITGKNDQDHLKNLECVLQRIQEAGLKLRKDKCSFLAPLLEYLSHKIAKEGLQPLPSKVEAIQGAPSPTNLTELRAFLGLLTYYSRFIPNMSSTLAPLYNLLKKEQKWKWENPEERAFKDIKRKFSPVNLSSTFRFSKETNSIFRLPMFTPEQNPKEHDSEPVEMVLLMDALDSSSVTSDDIRASLPGDPALRQALDHTLQGWSEETPKEMELMPFWSRRYELGACEVSPELCFGGLVWTRILKRPLDGVTATKAMPACHPELHQFGIPRTLVSDNGTGFTSEEFRQFMTRNGIRHLRTAPFHPSFNGLAERAVQTIKTGLKKVQQGSISQPLAEILLGYRRTPIASIGKSPSEMMFGHNIRSRLDLILPNPGESEEPGFKVGGVYLTFLGREVNLPQTHAGVSEPDINTEPEELIPQHQK
ncbi:K02A2.6-like [Cordylochernes scorpioides]|uniref:K02A2.6-like n=1 Tax=Cordylochernes scorpioides TaxID=51811 RepID=A0ABY6L1E0_9ARAC|nr:K02A2.6-like [Cordylochernes scorpioides]